ncbi:MAG: pyroglutamyl-peptidase I [Planctomycetes bacterium]|nr:pyroglutamyl-peptidase I [Planctomycetota bacterium]
MNETILLTGFGPFGSHERNPSGEGADLLADQVLDAEGFRLVTATLPVQLEAATALLQELISEHAPSAIIASGIHKDPAGCYQVELLAKNELQYDEVPDIDGNLIQDAQVEAEGPPQVVSTLPLAKIKIALESAGFQTELSEDAGRHVCNAVFYWLARQEVPAGFLHVPPTSAPQEVARALRVAAIVTAGRLVERRVEV